MKQLIKKFVDYLQYERNASPNTIREYNRDITEFHTFLTPPGENTRAEMNCAIATVKGTG